MLYGHGSLSGKKQQKNEIIKYMKKTGKRDIKINDIYKAIYI